MRILVTILYLRTALGLLFIATGISKCLDWRAFERAVTGFQLVPARLAPAVAILVVTLEITGGALLAAGFYPALGAAIIAGLLVVFNWALMANLLRGRRRLDCHCYGRGTLRIGWGHVVQNTVLLGVAAAIGVAPAGLFPPGGILIALAGAYTAALFLAAQEMAALRAGLVRMLSRIEVD